MKIKNITYRPFVQLLFAFGIVTLLFACSGEQKQKALPPQNVKVVKPTIKTVPIYKEFVGQIYGKVDIPVRARVEGYLEGIHFQEGSRVKKGQLLYNIDSQPFQAEVTAKENALREAQTALVLAENELKRYQPLVEAKAVSQSDYDATLATRDAAIASEKAARADLRISEINLGYATMTSPVDGIIGKTKAKVGEFVGRDPNPVILNTISNVSYVRVEFFLAENEYLEFANSIEVNSEGVPVRRDDRKEGELELILSNGNVHPYKGRADFMDREVNPMTGSLLIQASFPNPKRILRPGQYAKVKAKIMDRKDAVLVPQRCIIELQGQYSVYTVNKEGLVEIAPIVIGEKIDDYWVILEGVKAEDQIIIEGIQKVRSKSPVNPELITFKSKFTNK